MKPSIPKTFLSIALGSWLVLTSTSCESPAPKSQEEVLEFEITEGNVRNYFFRQGGIAAHMLTTSGLAPRVVWGFPPENTGIGVWFVPPAQETQIVAEGKLEPVGDTDGMWGVSTTLRAETSILRIKKAVLGNVRTVRDYFYGATIPPEFDYNLHVGESVVMTQNTLDGKHHIRLKLDPLQGTSVAIEGSQVTFRAGRTGHVLLRATATIDYKPLTPFAKTELLTHPTTRCCVDEVTKDNPAAFNALQFLTYKEKLLAGSWRFLTYFGRDTLLSLRLLLPILQAGPFEAGLGSVIDRLAADGGVAHEEALGDYAWYVRATSRLPPPPPPGDMFSPWYDYKMIDDDFMLPIVLDAYATSPAGQGRIQQFLTRTTPSGETYQSAVKRNIRFIIDHAKPFAADPVRSNLVAIKHPTVGNWRDSDAGLGGGKYPFDINVALVPAALRAAASLYLSGVLGSDTGPAAELNSMAAVWEANAAKFFQLEIPELLAKDRVSKYAERVGLNGASAVASINGPVRYQAVSLDADGNPVPVMHTDDGFVLLFTNPGDAYLQEAAGRILRPFPAGLRTEAGVVVASTALAPTDSTLHARFTRGDYHGTVIWSWQQAMLAAGLERQLERTDLQSATVSQLQAAQTALWEVIQSASKLKTGELWSWAAKDGKAEYVPFADAAVAENRFVDESNAAQLWSTVYLAVKPPAQ